MFDDLVKWNRLKRGSRRDIQPRDGVKRSRWLFREIVKLGEGVSNYKSWTLESFVPLPTLLIRNISYRTVCNHNKSIKQSSTCTTAHTYFNKNFSPHKYTELGNTECLQCLGSWVAQSLPRNITTDLGASRWLVGWNLEKKARVEP